GKTEAWYVIAAEPDAVIYHGLRADLAPDEVAAALASGRLAAHLHAEVVHAGDTLFTPAGTIHAIGGGIVLYEIQQYSDVTFRLHDWGRLGTDGRPREIHVEQGLAVADPTSHAHHVIPPQPLDDCGERRLLVACRYFALEARDFAAAQPLALDGATFHLLTVLAGRLEMTDEGGEATAVELGQTTLIPASAGRVRLEATPGTRALDAYVPDLARDVIEPLRARGVPDEAIARLGGGAAKGNDLLPLLAGRG
ncbi:MAG TPA: class I mannose-6-phosphate isomerase, partial [Thermomicrobiales bacterium]|nr:class I mannose-6-phosphate isomerase [Thermomicrobiales bacterium]